MTAVSTTSVSTVNWLLTGQNNQLPYIDHASQLTWSTHNMLEAMLTQHVNIYSMAIKLLYNSQSRLNRMLSWQKRLTLGADN
jgi:hypothetical protein